MGKFIQFLNERVDDSPYYPTTLPLSEYRGLSNPLQDDQPYGAEFKDVTKLWDIVDDLIADGIKPVEQVVNTRRLLATQDWLSTESGDESVFDQYTKLPVILEYQGKEYILDGHNRIAANKARGKINIAAYVFKAK